MILHNPREPEAIEKLVALSASKAKPALQPAPKKPQKLATVSTAEISEMHFDEIPHVVSDLLPVGLTVFAAPPKTGKSWFCLALSEAIAHGLPFFNRTTLPGDVLYLDLESRGIRVQERMRRMRCQPANNLDVAFEANDLQHGLLDQLSEWRKTHPSGRLVILDTFARVKGASPRNIDAYSADSQLLAPLQKWALDQNIAVVLVTHLRKQSSRYVADADPFELITGSNGQFGIADTAWLVTGQRTDEQRHLVISGRDLEAQDLVIFFDKGSCRWRCIGDAESVQRAQAIQSPIVRTILKMLKEASENEIRLTSTQIITSSIEQFGACDIVAPSELGKKLRELVPLLAECGVDYIPPGKNGGKYGRRHTFRGKVIAPRTEQLAV